MAKLPEELTAKLRQAQSFAEMTELLKAGGQDETTAEQLWKELESLSEIEAHELSLDELEAVSGGVSRDWATEGCAATVQPGSWCGTNDKCVIWSVTYDHPPTHYKCSRCGGWLYELEKEGGVTPMACRKCD